MRVRPASREAPPTTSDIAVRVLRAVVLGVLGAGLVLAGRTSGALDGVPGLIVAPVLLLLVPTSRHFSRRVLLAGCLVLGWTQLAWWVPLPLGTLGRVTVGLAVLAGALGAWVGAGARPVQRVAALVPRFRAVDLLVPASGGLGLAVLTPWLQGKSITQTLGLMLGGWDHSAHFSMVHMIRRFGVTVDALAAPADGTWQFVSYPQGYHAVVATIVEVVLGPRQGTLEVEMLAYTRAIALLLITVVMVLVAGFCALPVLRKRAAIAAPVATFVAAVLYLGPGANAIQGGFGNFVLACALVVALALLVVPLARVLTPLHLAAIGGALVGVAAGWVLMLALAAPVLLAALLPFRRRRWSTSPLRLVLCVLVALVVAATLARTALVILRVQSANPLVLTGGIERPHLGMVVAAVLAALGGCLLLARQGGGAGSRIAGLGLVPLVGAVTAVGLAVMQIRASGEITYYGLKFMTGLEIVLLPLVMIPVAYALARLPRRPRSGVLRFVGAGCVALAVTQVFGLATPDRAALAPEAPGAVNRATQLRALVAPPSTSDLAELVVRHGPLPSSTFFLDVPSDRRVDPLLAAQWLFSLTDSWTLEGNTIAGGIKFGEYAPADVAAAARRILLARPDAYVAVRPDVVRMLSTELDDPRLAARIIGL